MAFLGIAATYVAAATTFYWYLMATAVEESELLAQPRRQWRHAHSYRAARRRNTNAGRLVWRSH